MASAGQNEGCEVLEEFVCEAMPDADPLPPGPLGRGVNAGAHLLTELVSSATAATQERVAELRGMSIAQLLHLVRSHGAELSSEELLILHDIAAERAAQGNGSLQEAIELSRETMLEAIHRSK